LSFGESRFAELQRVERPRCQRENRDSEPGDRRDGRLRRRVMLANAAYPLSSTTLVNDAESFDLTPDGQSLIFNHYGEAQSQRYVSSYRGAVPTDERSRHAMIGTKLGPYEITAKLGEGGMGEVYRARDTKLERDVAIKVLPAGFVEDHERLQRFEREAKLLAQLHHPNIASIFGLEDSDGWRAVLYPSMNLCLSLARSPKPWRKPTKRESSTETSNLKT
jgi:serine/threonine protein kinase